MTFGPQHYVPVLKAKSAEKHALGRLSPATRQHVIPLLEIVERTKQPLNEHLTTGFRDLAPVLSGYQRCLLDARELEADGHTAASQVFSRAYAQQIRFTPVTGISRHADVYSAVSFANSHGVGIRLVDEDLNSGRLTNDLAKFLQRHHLYPTQVDLIVDIGDIAALIPIAVVQKMLAFLSEIPHKGHWRTLTITGSSFPLSMRGVQQNSEKMTQRTEWLAWRDNLYAHRATLERLPTFSDCGIQHRLGVEHFNVKSMRPSPTIRYATDEHWLLIKGSNPKFTPAKAQFPTLATKLVHGRLNPNYGGPAHCNGCGLTQKAANGHPNLGSAQVWRRIGTIHHITTVVRDGLGNLQWP